MASFTVRRATSHPLVLSPSSTVYVVGQRARIQEYSTLLHGRLSGSLAEGLWTTAVDSLPDSGSLTVCMDWLKVIVLPTGASRHNCAANPHVLKTELRAGKLRQETESLAVLLLCPREHAMPLVATLARHFPQFTRKTIDQRLESVTVELVYSDQKEVAEEDVSALSRLAANIRTTARLVDTPANELNCDAFVREARAVGEELGVDTMVIRGEELKERGFGGIYNVGKAAVAAPAFIVLSHRPKGAKKTFALVGKGIIYDTGGHSLKDKTAMIGWKCDMAGAAAVLMSFSTLVQSGFRETLHVCLCVAENSISPFANKPDDIITLLSGRTVEVNNTDAEGRLVLADGVYYAKNELKADFILDLATLTVAQGTATGKLHAAVLTNDEEMEYKAIRAGQYSGDLVHPLVFTPDLHMRDFDSTVADCKNANMSGTMMGPPSATAGLFIGANINFGEGMKWVHVDMGALGMDHDRATAYGVGLVTSLLGEVTAPSILGTPGF